MTKLERLLRLEPDTLGRLLGYAAPSDQPTTTVLDAVRSDPRLDESGRELLSTVYRWLVRREPVGDGRS